MSYYQAMKQLEYFDIQNPCRQICRFNRQKICAVCFRSMNERQHWDEADDEEKRTTLRRSHQRRLAYRRAAWLAQQQKKHRPAAQQFELFAQESSLKGEHRPSAIAEEDKPQLSLFPE